MRILTSTQQDHVSNAVQAKFSMAAPILEAAVHSLNRARLGRLGGIDQITIWDLAREIREGFGDAGICFEYAVHEAVATRSQLIQPLASEVLEGFCNIQGEADSILFGPEKNGVIPIVESVQASLTDDSRVYVGNRGQPPKLKRYIPKIVNAFFRDEARNVLPRSIAGLWKADLFLGNAGAQQWVGTTVKINPKHLNGAQGLRIGIYPRQSENDRPRLDEDLNLVRLPLPYDGQFMELFYKTFYLVKAFLQADAHVPKPVHLPDAEDRYIAKELERRREFKLFEVVDAIRRMGQPNLLVDAPVTELPVAASLSEAAGLQPGAAAASKSDLVSLAPESIEG